MAETLPEIVRAWMHMEHGERKRAALIGAGDTIMGDTVERYRSIIEGAGFELAFEEQFASKWGHGSDTLFAYARRDGLFLHFDSFGPRVNSGKLEYNWLPVEPDKVHWGLTSSGGYREYDGEPYRLWIGDHDCREGLLHNIAKLADAGKFLSPWHMRPSCFWFTHYMDWEQKDEAFEVRTKRVEALTAERLARMPDWALAMVSP